MPADNLVFIREDQVSLIQSVLDFNSAMSRAETQYAVAARLMRSAASAAVTREVLESAEEVASAAAEAVSEAVANLAAQLDLYA